jgi:alpha-ribazole phosphatase
MDVPLGRTADEDIRQCLRNVPRVTRIVSSPAQRCRGLAIAVATRDRVPLAEDDRLLELDFGRWEGRAWADIDRGEIDAWAANPFDHAPGGGESVRSLCGRLDDLLRAMVRDGDGPTLVVTHQGPMRVLMTRFSGRPLGDLSKIEVAFGATRRFCVRWPAGG